MPSQSAKGAHTQSHFTMTTGDMSPEDRLKAELDPEARKLWELEQTKRRCELDAGPYITVGKINQGDESGGILEAASGFVTSLVEGMGSVVSNVDSAIRGPPKTVGRRPPRARVDVDPRVVIDPMKVTDRDRALVIEPFAILATPIPPHANMTWDEARAAGPPSKGSPYWQKLARGQHVEAGGHHMIAFLWKMLDHEMSLCVMVWHANTMGMDTRSHTPWFQLAQRRQHRASHSPKATNGRGATKPVAPVSTSPGTEAAVAQSLIQRALLDSEIQQVVDAATPEGWRAEIILTPKKDEERCQEEASVVTGKEFVSVGVGDQRRYPNKIVYPNKIIGLYVKDGEVRADQDVKDDIDETRNRDQSEQGRVASDAGMHSPKTPTQSSEIAIDIASPDTPGPEASPSTITAYLAKRKARLAQTLDRLNKVTEEGDAF